MPIYSRQMKKPMLTMIIILGILFGIIFLYKAYVHIRKLQHFAAMSEIAPVVSTTTAQYSNWQPQLKAVSTLRGVLGVNITAQLAGMIVNTYIKPGSMVKKGMLLVQQNAAPNVAQLHSLQATTALALITYNRDKAQLKAKAVSQQQVDTDLGNLKSDQAQVAEQAATVEKLTIRAPFTGKLGISNVYPGQYLNPGDEIVTLQTLDPMYADFFLPQQALAQIQVGQEVDIVTDTFPDEVFVGKISTINPEVDLNTRNVEVEATIANPKYKLFPGMFANATVKAGNPQPFITVPQTAVSFNSYGNIVYIVKQSGKDDKGKPEFTVMQSFVTTGETRGDQITILRGLNAGDVVVTSGQLKLRNGSKVAINNDIQPANNPAPNLPNEHGQEQPG